MASVWVQTRQRRGEHKLAGGLPNDHAVVALAALSSLWQGGGPERKLLPVGSQMVSLIEYGMPTGIMWCEFLSPPSAPEPGQPKRAVKL
jgi:hypothetical protein